MQRFNPLKPQNEGKKPHPKPLPKGTIPSPEPVGSAPNLIENNEKDGLELHFLKRPGPDVLEKFHATKELPLEQRWHFHWKGKFWYAKRNEATRKFAAALIAHPAATGIGLAQVAAPAGLERPPIHNIVPVTFTSVPAWRSRLLRSNPVTTNEHVNQTV